MPSGYFDSVHVPLHLPPSAYHPQQAAGAKAKGKGKGKDITDSPAAAAAKKYHVVQEWTQDERDDMLRKVSMASLRA